MWKEMTEGSRADPSVHSFQDAGYYISIEDWDHGWPQIWISTATANEPSEGGRTRRRAPPNFSPRAPQCSHLQGKQKNVLRTNGVWGEGTPGLPSVHQAPYFASPWGNSGNACLQAEDAAPRSKASRIGPDWAGLGRKISSNSTGFRAPPKPFDHLNLSACFPSN